MNAKLVRKVSILSRSDALTILVCKMYGNCWSALVLSGYSISSKNFSATGLEESKLALPMEKPGKVKCLFTLLFSEDFSTLTCPFKAAGCVSVLDCQEKLTCVVVICGWCFQALPEVCALVAQEAVGVECTVAAASKPASAGS